MTRPILSLRLIGRCAALLWPLLMLTSCEADSYDKGEGQYSLLRADFVEAHADGDKRIDAITTDDGELLTLTKTFTSRWVTTPDSTYRCILYYTMVNQGNGGLAAEPVSAGLVPCPAIKTKDKFEAGFRTDPVKLESVWMSKSGKYLNLRLQLKTGTTDDSTAVQQLGIVADTLVTHPDQRRSLRLLLHHDQGGVPEYYSTTAFLSLPTDSLAADTVTLTINTYQGLVVKSFLIPL